MILVPIIGFIVLTQTAPFLPLSFTNSQPCAMQLVPLVVVCQSTERSILISSGRTYQTQVTYSRYTITPRASTSQQHSNSPTISYTAYSYPYSMVVATTTSTTRANTYTYASCGLSSQYVTWNSYFYSGSSYYTTPTATQTLLYPGACATVTAQYETKIIAPQPPAVVGFLPPPVQYVVKTVWCWFMTWYGYRSCNA